MSDGILQTSIELGLAALALGGGVGGAMGMVRAAWRAGGHWGADLDYRNAALQAQRDIELARAAAAQALPPDHYAPHVTYSPHIHSQGITSSAAAAAGPELSEAGRELPGMIDLADLAFQPTMQSVLLGVGEGGELLTVPAGRLCHVAIAGHTGGGKSNLLRLIIPQLQAIGARVVLCDPHYTEFDQESGDDWRPIAQRLYQEPAYEPARIDESLDWFIDELDRRLELRRRQQTWGAPLFIALDELPVIADSVRGAVDRLTRLLREGRKVYIYVVGSAQDFLVKTLGGSTGARDCYRTAYYTGGDSISARSLLDMPQRDIDEGRLQTGVAYLRSSATTPARLVRVPYASNRGIAGLLSDDAPTIEVRGPENRDSHTHDTRGSGDGENVDTGDTSVVPGMPDDALMRELVRRGKSANEIVRIVGGSRGRVLQRVKEIKAETAAG